MAVPEVERPAYGVHTRWPVRYLPDAEAEHRHLIPVCQDAGAPVRGCCADRHGGGSLAVRRSKTSRTAIEPSPIAVAARLTDPLRTSPTAKTPGRLVSRNRGAWSLSSSWASGMLLPVSRNPWASSASWLAS